MDTIGKRIAQHRKNLGLTQDQLAEKLGITAQAVSKWENDLSCPDIAMLPRLADIFATSTDALLGRENPLPVCQSVVVEKEDTEKNGFTYNSDNGKMDFHWDGVKLEGIGLACWVLLVGIVYLITRLIPIDVSLWNILWPSFLLVFGICGLYPRFSVIRMGCTLTGAYFLLEKLQILSVELDSGILTGLLFLMFGVALLTDSLRKHQKRKHNACRGSCRQFQNDYHTERNTFFYDAAFGDSTQTVVLDTLERGEISVSFGDYTVDLRGISAIEKNCQLSAECAFGQLNIQVPRCYCVMSGSSTAFASFQVQGQPDSNPKGIIHLDADVSFGQITVIYM